MEIKFTFYSMLFDGVGHKIMRNKNTKPEVALSFIYISFIVSYHRVNIECVKYNECVMCKIV